MNDDTLDPGIPVLTEIVSTAGPSKNAASTTAAQDAVLFPGASHPGDLRHQDDWDRMECEIREQVIMEVLQGIRPLLEQRLQESMDGILRAAVGEIAQQLQAGLHHAVQGVASEAVAREITKRQSL